MLRWESPERKLPYIGSCMIGLAELEPARWLQPASVEREVPAGRHVLHTTHELVEPVGGYPGAVRIRLEREVQFEARCGEVVEIAVAPTLPGGPLSPIESLQLDAQVR